MKELKKYKLLAEKKRELEIKLRLPGVLQEETIKQQLKEMAADLNKYEVAFQLLTERENKLVELRYGQNLSIITVSNLLYISKSTYYEDVRSIETKIHSFFEGVKMNIGIDKALV